MKTNSLASVKLALIATIAFVQAAKADFDITFSTGNGTLGNPVFNVGGSVATPASYLSGTAFRAQLFVGAAGATFGQLTAIGTGGLTISGATAGDTTGIRTFLTGGGAGFINGGTLSVTSGSFSANSSASYQLRVWDAAFSSYDAAVAGNGLNGASGITAITLGGTLAGNPPTVITSQANLHGAFGLVPEPASIALGLFGAAGLIFRRRK